MKRALLLVLSLSTWNALAQATEQCASTHREDGTSQPAPYAGMKTVVMTPMGVPGTIPLSPALINTLTKAGGAWGTMCKSDQYSHVPSYSFSDTPPSACVPGNVFFRSWTATRASGGATEAVVIW